MPRGAYCSRALARIVCTQMCFRDFPPLQGETGQSWGDAHRLIRHIERMCEFCYTFELSDGAGCESAKRESQVLTSGRSSDGGHGDQTSSMGNREVPRRSSSRKNL